MSSLIYDTDVWSKVDTEDLWVYDKLILSRYFGYTAGAAGIDLPAAGEYIVRPITNLMGMGKGASLIKFVNTDTTWLPAGSFWCEVFQGRHLSVDLIDGKTEVVYQGFPVGLNRFSRWEKLDEEIEHPEFIVNLSKKYGVANYESIGGKIIEVHLRSNPDWAKHKADILVPIWKDQTMEFVEDEDTDRAGFVVIRKKTYGK